MVILLLMYESGCRVQGMIDLKENDYTNVVDCIGLLYEKENKMRLVLISKNCSNILKKPY